MRNVEIARSLAKIADLVERGGGNPWRVRAYRNAVRSVERHDVEISDMLERGRSPAVLAGVGTELARLITELATTGRAALLEDLEAAAPAAPPAARRRRAQEERSSMRLIEATPLAGSLVAFLADEPAVTKVDVVGEVRRKMERVDHLEILVASSDVPAVFGRLRAHAGLDELVAGATRATARLRGALPISVEVVPPPAWGTALVDATGPAAHARALRARTGGRAYPTEEDVYRAAGLATIAPELRASGEELEAAREGRLPVLIEPGDIRGDLQMHTGWSDGAASVAQMAAACRKRGYEYIAITDHSASLTIANGLSPERVAQQWREIEEARAKGPGIVLLKSLEVDVLPDGTLDLPEAHLAGLDCVLAAVHMQQKLIREVQTERILRAVRHPAVDILAHPTGRRGRRPPYDVDLEAVLRACAEEGVAVEIDCSPDRSDLSAENARMALELGCTLVIDTDAHSPRELDFMAYGVGQARRAWAEAASVLNTRSWPEMRKWLQRRGRRQALDDLGG